MFFLKRSTLVFCLVASFVLAGLPLNHARPDTFRPVVRGKRGVVAGGQPLSVEAGLRILQRGGNAVDAGVATILAASVIEFSHFSFGGEVPILIKLKGQKVVVIEGMGQKVTAFKPGDEVCGTAEEVFADYVCVHSSSIRLADND